MAFRLYLGLAGGAAKGAVDSAAGHLFTEVTDGRIHTCTLLTVRDCMVGEGNPADAIALLLTP